MIVGWMWCCIKTMDLGSSCACFGGAWPCSTPFAEGVGWWFGKTCPPGMCNRCRCHQAAVIVAWQWLCVHVHDAHWYRRLITQMFCCIMSQGDWSWLLVSGCCCSYAVVYLHASHSVQQQYLITLWLVNPHELLHCLQLTQMHATVRQPGCQIQHCWP